MGEAKDVDKYPTMHRQDSPISTTNMCSPQTSVMLKLRNPELESVCIGIYAHTHTHNYKCSNMYLFIFQSMLKTMKSR